MPKRNSPETEDFDCGAADAGTSGAAGLPPSRAALIEALFREHNQRLVRFLATRLSSDAEAKEVAQEAYVRLLQLDQPQAGGFLRALLYKTASNLAIDRIRRRRLEEQSRRDEPPSLDVDPHSPETLLANSEEMRIVAECLNELSPRCRQAILLSRFQGLSSTEIAASLGVSTRMIRTYITEATLLIRDRLAKAHTRGGAPKSRHGGKT